MRRRIRDFYWEFWRLRAKIPTFFRKWQNPNTLPNPNPNSHRHFFELVEKYDDDNLENYFF